MPPKEKEKKAPPNEKAIAARAAAEAWKPTPQTFISFIRGFATLETKVCGARVSRNSQRLRSS